MITRTTTYKTTEAAEVSNWFRAGSVDDFPENGGSCIWYKGLQIAIFNFSTRDKWYACQNLCPHKQQMILSRGIIGSFQGHPKVACPFHKKTFSLETGCNLNGNLEDLAVYPVKVENAYVYVGFSF